MKRSTLMTITMASRARTLAVVLCAIAAILSARASMSAQTSATGAVSGRVVDGNRALVRGAEIELRNTTTGRSQRQASGGAGQYVFPRVLPGEYVLTVRAQGFRQASVSGLKVEVAQAYSLDVALDVGDVAETVNVAAGAEAGL